MATALTRVILDRDPELRDSWVNLTPMGRLGEPEDLKGALFYAFSPLSAHRTDLNSRSDLQELSSTLRREYPSVASRTWSRSADLHPSPRTQGGFGVHNRC